MNGILNILKPTGMTSHDVVSKVRKILNTKRVGHAGTLDPNVAGVLVICVGKGTKFSEILINGDKEYVCELKLGQKTDTQDSYGKVIEQKEVTFLSKEDILSVLKEFEGEQLQVPPIYSAVKLNGKKLYEYARENIAVEKPGKPVNIKKLQLLKYENDRILMKIKCSKGTYMRTLCNDIGDKLKCLGHMGILVRTDAKGLKIENSVTIEELKYLYDMNRLSECLLPVDKVVPMEKVTVNQSFYDKLIVGNEIPYHNNKILSEEFYIYCNNELIGIGQKKENNKIKISTMLI